MTGTNPYLLASFLATETLFYLFPPTISTAAGRLGLLALILNFKSLAISSRIYYLDPLEQSI
jgi:hypothetical protein